MITGVLLLKGLIAALIVGFVTSSIRSWVDRVFLVIMLVTIVGLPVTQAITVNLQVLALASILILFRQGKTLRKAAPVGKSEWLFIVIPAFIGGVTGRLVVGVFSPKLLLAILGVYAILVGLRIFFIRPLQERETKAHTGWLAPVGLASGFFTGLISAGGKPFAVPAYNNAMGHHPQRAYAFATLAVVTAALAALFSQLAFVAIPSVSEIMFALYEFVLITTIALIVSKFWTEKLNKIVNLTIAPVLIVVGIRFLFIALAGS